MPDTKFERDTHRFELQGLDLNRPVDSVKPNKYVILKNLRSYQAGRIEPRSGITDIAAVVANQTPVHSCRRLNDPNNAAFTRILGTGTHLAYGTTSFTDLDSGYSGDPLALVPWAPENSPAPFMYVADRSRMRKVGMSGVLHTIGWAPPVAALDEQSALLGVALTTVPLYKVIDEFDSLTGWSASGVVVMPVLTNSRSFPGFTYILYDVGSTGWCSIVPNSMVGIGVGERLVFQTNGETQTIQAVFAGSTATTIASILFDSGTSGLCSIVLTTPFDPQVQVDAIIRNTTTSENARILGVIKGPDGNTSIRLSAPSTWAATNAVQMQDSFRIYCANTHAAAESAQGNSFSSSTSAAGTGYITKTAALDLSLLATGVPTRPDDFMHISLLFQYPEFLTEIKVLLDVDSTTNDFSQNYYWKSIRANDLSPAEAGLSPLISTLTTVDQRSNTEAAVSLTPDVQPPPPVIDPNTDEDIYQYADFTYTNPDGSIYRQATPGSPSPTSQQLDLGSSVWCEVRFRISDLIRVGTDMSRTLKNVAAIRVVMTGTAAQAWGVDSWWIGGGYGPDTTDPTSSPLLYKYRVREVTTNVASNFSPPSRLEMNPVRQSVTIKPPQYAAPSGTSVTAASSFVLDIVRFGGAVPAWHYVGTTPNTSSPSFTDTYPDDVIAGQPILEDNNYQPWPIIGIPVTGTTGIVSGTTVKDSGTNFNLSWAPGTRILINNQPYTIYRVITTALLELYENALSQSAVTWRIDEPVILAQPLPCLWNTDDTWFACGDLINPGRLYYSNPHSETVSGGNYLDVTSPTEPLMNGVYHNLRSYVFSSEEMYQILPTGNPSYRLANDPSEPWRFEKLPFGRGMFSRWGLTREPAPILMILSKDGIYVTNDGSQAVSITDDDLLPMFPNEGNLGGTGASNLPPNMVAAQVTNFRLSFYDGYFYFDFINTSSVRATLVFASDLNNQGTPWLYDVYTPGILFHYGEEGNGVHALLLGGADATTGHLYQYAGNSDNGTGIACQIRTGSLDQGDPRLNKLYGDIMLDCDAQGVTLTCTPGTNNYGTTFTGVSVSNSGRAQTAIPLGTAWQTGKNIALDITFTVSTGSRPQLYIWEPRWTFESAPISALAWEISPTTFGKRNFKYLGMYRITHVSTATLTLTITVDNVVQTLITIPNSGGVYKMTAGWFAVYKGKLYKFRLSSTTEFRLDTRDSFIQIKEWASEGPYEEVRVFGDYAMIEG